MNGLSTLNRLLGKKNKDDTFIVSRSTSNISKSITNLDTSSQQNKIVPIVVNNVPFEQTFRVTVYLPKNQLYVERIGAKTKLDKLLDQICDNKHLNRNKFEFRHPGDMSMVFNGDSTIGEVGLNELKMVLKSESQFNSNFQDIKLNYKSQTSNSVTSSELSRNSKSQLRKSSPYSSSNSLNSLDSTGQNTSLKMVPPVAPARKKRLAPRPPSQIIIPEQEIVSTNLSDVLLKEPLSILPRRNFHVSSQQLHSTDGYQGNHKSKLSINNAINVIEYETDKNNNVKLPTTPEPVEFKRMSIVTRPMSIEPVESKQSVYLNRSRTSSESSEVNDAMKSYTDVTQSRRTPTVLVNQSEVKPHKKSAPAPPPRSVPVPSPRTVQEISPSKHDDLDDSMNEITNTNNVSKVMLNVNNNQQLKPHTTADTTNSQVSIQIINNKPKAEYIPTIVQPETKRTIEDVIVETKMLENRYYSEPEVVKSESVVKEEIIEIINVPVEKIVEQKVVKVEEDRVKEEVERVNHSKVHVSVKEVELSRPTSPLWTYTLPAPPIFADNNASLDNQQPTQLCTETNTFYNDFTSTVGVERMCSETTTVISDTTIQPFICERKMLDDSFITIVNEDKLMDDTESEKSAEVITSDIEDGYQGGKMAPMVTIVEKKFNFQKDKMANELMKADDDFDISHVVLRHQITRSDSFHSIGQQNFRTSALSFSPHKSEMKSKSISYISLVQAQKNEALSLSKSNSNNMLYSKRKSTSELSITDSPSLQSLEVMKSILNSSRKSSLQDAVIMEQPSLPYKAKQMDENNIVTVQSVTTVDIKVPEKYSPIEETIAEKDKVPEHSNKWKYQGPPKINLSTWSERPKIEVSIKSDNDYKFGGSSTLPRIFKTTTSNNNTTAITINQTDDGVNDTKIPVVVNTDENTMDEVDNRLPKVLGFEYKKKNSFVQLREHVKMPADNNSSDYSKISIKPRPVSMDVQIKSWTASPASQIISFNRLSTSHNKFVPVVYGFKLNNISEVAVAVNIPEPLSPKEPMLLPVEERKPVVESNIVVENKTVVDVVPSKIYEKEPAPVVPVKPSYLRSTSVDDMSKKFRFTTYDNRNSLSSVPEPNPFSQQTLRRTGLKQKILLQDTETESMFGRVIEVQPTTIKLSNQHAANQNERKGSVDVVVKSSAASRQLSTPNPPPPPPMAPSFKTMKKPTQQPMEADTRNQLLDSIKRFNRDLLKRE